MKTWHYNVLSIIRSEPFKEELVNCLADLEGTDKDHSIVVSMLLNYYNKRNKKFSTNWIYLPKSRATLHINRKGIYVCPEYEASESQKKKLDDINNRLYSAIGDRNWIVAFTKVRPPDL